MSAAPNLNQIKTRDKLNFTKMSGAGNDFIIFDERKKPLNFSPKEIQKISERKNIGCDQFIILKNSQKAQCFMEIFNSDGSTSGACGNATRCVAAIIFDENPDQKIITIQTIAGILECKKNTDKTISVNMGIPKFNWQSIPLANEINSQKIALFNHIFSSVNIGNPHAVTFLNKNLSDEDFFSIGSKVEVHEFFPQKTNVEFAKLINENLIEVRVWERGVGETMACGTGACAVGILAIKHEITKSKKIITRFKGGDLEISWGGEGKPVIMSGGYQKIFQGEIDENFLC